jgi:hypothetical protein
LGAGIDFKEIFDPPLDPHSDYRLIYEASFEPNMLDKAYINLAITDAGYLAIGMETYARIAKRSQLKAWRAGFAVGHEPATASRDGLQTLFDVVTAGKFRLSIGSLFRIMTSITMNVYASDIESMKQLGYSPRHGMWKLSPIPEQPPQGSVKFSGRLLEYRPW